MTTLFVYAAMSDDQIHSRLGTSEYSYYFVLREFYPLLLQLADIVQLNAIDDAFRAKVQYCRDQKEPHALLFFSAPQNLVDEIPCPVIPVFAWEFTDFPGEAWGDNKFNHWQTAFTASQGAITHSNFVLENINSMMGSEFPAWSIPAPVFERFQTAVSVREGRLQILPGVQTLKVTGITFDSHASLEGNDANASAQQPENRAIHASVSISVAANIPSLSVSDTDDAVLDEQETELNFGGVIYTSVLNPFDGRKNWQNMLKTYCWALRDRFDATLVLKFTHHHPKAAVDEVLKIVSDMPGFRCRVVVIGGYLDDHEYRALINMTTFVVNTSTGEGQCLPLMEYMSAGVPAIAPDHSALADYINKDNALIVRSNGEPAVFPHDDRVLIRTQQNRIDLDSLAIAFKQSYDIAHNQRETYLSMSQSAIDTLRPHCSDDAILEKLGSVIQNIEQMHDAAG